MWSAIFWALIVLCLIIGAILFAIGWDPNAEMTVTTHYADRAESVVRPVRWWEFVGFKLLALLPIAVGFVLLYEKLGGRALLVAARIGGTALLASAAVAFLGMAWWLVADGRKLLETLYRPPKQQEANERPGKAIRARPFKIFPGYLLRLPLGWAVLAVIPAIIGASILTAVPRVWRDDSPAGTHNATGGRLLAALDAFDRVALYGFWGIVIIVAIVDAVKGRRSLAEGIIVVVGAAAFGLYIALNGIWP
ncbi:MAG TPA: hypothetical protein VFC19_24580 [Candidatus Limnocylindrales bacterium]|nr:hypothetical protein [Candidatus Limnocylindrales bacterium]